MQRHLIMLLAGALIAGAAAIGASTVNPGSKHAWTESAGWTNWRDANGGADGVEVRKNHLRGWIWCEGVGWLTVGQNGPYPAPASQTGANFGVNIAPDGTLSGYGWFECGGWANFDTSSLGVDRARFDFTSYRFRGYAWCEGLGWLNLDDATHFVAATVLCPADGNGDGQVDINDLAFVLANWGAGAGSPADCNEDGTVNINDLACVLANWGPCP